VSHPRCALYILARLTSLRLLLVATLILPCFAPSPSLNAGSNTLLFFPGSAHLILSTSFFTLASVSQLRLLVLSSSPATSPSTQLIHFAAPDLASLHPSSQTSDAQLSVVLANQPAPARAKAPRFLASFFGVSPLPQTTSIAAVFTS
jgi:hypothetical protein